MPRRAIGSGGVEETDEESGDEEAQESGETAQGSLLWRGFSRVVALEVNIRAPGVLGRLQSEMRAGEISDDMWQVYLSRVMERDDGRMQQPPFSSSCVQYIVHRHRIRVRQSFKNAVEHCLNYCFLKAGDLRYHH